MGTEWGQVGTRWGPGGNRVGTRWEPGGDQVGVIGSHSVSTCLGLAHAWGSIKVGTRLGTRWEASGAKLGPHVVPTWPPLGPHVVPTWSTHGPHVVPTWSPHGPHVVPTWSPRGPRLVTARVSATRFPAWFPHGSRLVPPLGGVVGASDTVLLSLARLRLVGLGCCSFERRRHGRRRMAGSAAFAPVQGRRMWTRGDIDAAPNGNVTVRQAHWFLSWWRDEASDMQQTPTMDLFDCAAFDWIGYIKHHADKDAIIPHRVCIIGFEIARLGVIDTNTHKARVDFVVHRDDLRIVRLHPSQSKEARPVITLAAVATHGGTVRPGERVEVGRGAHALSFTAGAGAKGRDGKGCGRGEALNAIHFETASQADIMQPSEVRRWLDERLALWPETRFTFDVTDLTRPLFPRDVPFPWHYFVSGVPALRALHPFEAVYVVWVDGRAALYFKSEAGREVVVDLGIAGRRNVTMSEDVVNRIDWTW